MLILWSRKCSAQIFAADRRGLANSILFSADLKYFTLILIFEYFADFRFFRMSFGSSNDNIHRCDWFCRGIPIIPLANVAILDSLSRFASWSCKIKYFELTPNLSPGKNNTLHP